MSVSYETLDKLKKQLQEVKELGMPISTDLYSHLTEVFNRIMLHHQDDGYEKFEEISALVKQTNFKIQDPKSDSEVNAKAGVIENKQMMEVLQKLKNLLNEYPEVSTGERKKYVTTDVKCVIPNYPENAEMFEWAGIGFGPDISYIIQKSIKRLAMMSGATSLKFFGKILCTEQDYWVAQGTLNVQEQKPSNPIQELRGNGTNEAVFWVTHDLMNDWIQLPDVQPQHIKDAKPIIKRFTGNLNADIEMVTDMKSNVGDKNPYSFKERHLLRAQLARIQHATQICPAKTYEIDEESQAVKFAEEGPDLGTDALRSLEAWCHYPPLILNAGRCTHPVPEGAGGEDGGENEELTKLQESDPTVDRFKALNEDKKVQGMENWTSKVCGDTQQYNKVGGEGTVSYAVNVISSVRWPGSVTVAKSGQYASIYVGDGIKRGDPFIDPSGPPDIQTEPKDNVEEPEPNGVDPPPEGEAPAEGDGGEGGDE